MLPSPPLRISSYASTSLREGKKCLIFLLFSSIYIYSCHGLRYRENIQQHRVSENEVIFIKDDSWLDYSSIAVNSKGVQEANGTIKWNVLVESLCESHINV